MSSWRKPKRSPEQEKLFTRWKDELKTYLLVCKTGVEYKGVEYQIIDMMGKPVPYKEMGIATWGEFLFEARDVFELCKFPSYTGNHKRFLFLKQYTITDEQAHIQSMIQGQEKPKTRKNNDGTVKDPTRRQVDKADYEDLLRDAQFSLTKPQPIYQAKASIPSRGYGKYSKRGSGRGRGNGKIPLGQRNNNDFSSYGGPGAGQKTTNPFNYSSYGGGQKNVNSSYGGGQKNVNSSYGGGQKNVNSSYGGGQKNVNSSSSYGSGTSKSNNYSDYSSYNGQRYANENSVSKSSSFGGPVKRVPAGLKCLMEDDLTEFDDGGFDSGDSEEELCFIPVPATSAKPEILKIVDFDKPISDIKPKPVHVPQVADFKPKPVHVPQVADFDKPISDIKTKPVHVPQVADFKPKPVHVPQVADFKPKPVHVPQVADFKPKPVHVPQVADFDKPISELKTEEIENILMVDLNISDLDRNPIQMGPSPHSIPIKFKEIWRIVSMGPSKLLENTIVFRRKQYIEQFLDLEKKITEFYNSEEGKKYIVRGTPTQGFYVAYWSEKKKWIRVEIIKSCKPGVSVISAFAYDYGEFITADLRSNQVRYMKKEYTKVPKVGYFGRVVNLNGAIMPANTLNEKAELECSFVLKTNHDLSSTPLLYIKI